MFRKLLLVSFMICQLSMQAQYIQNISVIPTYPGPLDSVKVLIDLSFNTGNCELANETHSIINDTIRIDVYHCPGPLNFVCSITDTINVGLLATGNYATKITVHKKNYFSADPCAGSNPVDSSDLQLIVFPGSGIGNIANESNLVFFQQKSRSILLGGPEQRGASLLLFNSIGSLILEKDFDSSNRIHAPELSIGVYLYKLITKDGKSSSGKFSVQ